MSLINHWQSIGIEFVFRSGKTRIKTSLFLMQWLKQYFVKSKRAENETSRDVANMSDIISTRGQSSAPWLKKTSYAIPVPFTTRNARLHETYEKFIIFSFHRNWMETERTCDEQFPSCSEPPHSLKRGSKFQFANFLKENENQLFFF